MMADSLHGCANAIARERSDAVSTFESQLYKLRQGSNTLPQPAEHDPEQPIEAIQFGSGPLPPEDGELLAKSNGFQREFVTGQEKGTQVSDHRTGKGKHHPILVERRPSVAGRIVPVQRFDILRMAF